MANESFFLWKHVCIYIANKGGCCLTRSMHLLPSDFNLYSVTHSFFILGGLPKIGSRKLNWRDYKCRSNNNHNNNNNIIYIAPYAKVLKRFTMKEENRQKLPNLMKCYVILLWERNLIRMHISAALYQRYGDSSVSGNRRNRSSDGVANHFQDNCGFGTIWFRDVCVVQMMNNKWFCGNLKTFL